MKKVKEFRWYMAPRKAILIKRYSRGKVLNVGSGDIYLKGSINLDIDPSKPVDVLADFHFLPFKDKSIDVCLAFDIIEHSDRPYALLRELERVCKDEGNIVLTTNDFDIVPKNWTADRGHKFYINKKILRNLLGKDYKVYNMGKDMLVVLKNPKRLDRLFYAFFTILVEIYRKLTLQPKGRATHWR